MGPCHTQGRSEHLMLLVSKLKNCSFAFLCAHFIYHNGDYVAYFWTVGLTTVGQSSRMTVKKDSQARHRHLHRHFQQATQNLELLHQGSLFLCGLGQWRFRLASLISSQRRRFSYCAQRDNARRGDEAFLFDVLHVCIAAGIWHVSTRQMVLSTASL